MLRRYPYWFLLFISLLAWCAAAWRYHTIQEEQATDRLARKVSQDIAARQKTLGHLLQHHKNELLRLTSGTAVNKDVTLFTRQPFYLYYYVQDSLRFWNNNLAIPRKSPTAYPVQGMLTEENGSSYFARRLELGSNRRLIIFFPLTIIYPFENEYLKSNFPASSFIPSTALISEDPLVEQAPPILVSGRRIGYLNIATEEARIFEPDGWVVGLCCLGVLLFFMWVQRVCVYLSDKRRYGLIGVLLVSIVLLRLLFYFTGLPLGLGETHLFSPQLYASNAMLPSLGDVIINGVISISLLVFALNRIPHASLLRRVKQMGFRLVLGAVFSLLMVFAAYTLVRVAISIVQDSNIYFDLQHLYALDMDTVCGLITICILASNVVVTIHFCRLLFQSLFPARWQKYPFIVLCGALLLAAESGTPFAHICIFFLLWMLTVTILLDIPRFTISPDPFSVSSLFWTAFLCVSSALLLEYFNYEREHETRKKFAEQLITRHDDAMEWNFNTIAKNIEADSEVRHYVKHPTPALRNKINDHLNILYLNSQLNNYQTQLYFFDTSGNGLYNTDTQSYTTLKQRLASSLPTPTPGLYYTENALDDHYYIAEIPVTNTNGKTTTTIGALFIDLAQKKTATETVFPELLQPARVNKAQKDAGYYYAVYANKRLLTQSNDYPFPFYLNGGSKVQKEEFEWHSYPEISTLTYRTEGFREVIVARTSNQWQEMLTLFSYLFGLQLMLMLSIFLFRVSSQWGNARGGLRPAINFTLRRRIQVSMLGIVLFSFLIIAVTTIAFFRQRYNQNNRRNIQSLTQRIERALQQYLKDESGKDNNDIAAVTHTPAFRHFITELARSQKTDINLFDAQGRLLSASQNDIFEKALLAPVMQPEVFHQLSKGTQLLSIRNEQIGGLHYVSSYVPLRREDSRIVGFINIPLFSIQKELDAQIADILVALINLYAFIFLLSSLLAVVATGWLTRTLNVIIHQFERLTLQENELLEWPYEDEIGLLVREYNKMVRKVEEHAALLAQSEREGAWREMARQVAHEIKNPLTPMKLNIQYLQNALSSNRPDIHKLAERVSISIIEQIDNLTYIASEFSNFAKMPEARAEVIVLNELLEKTVALHQNKPEISIVLHQPATGVKVMADYSQLLRVFTNLLQNAIQAIPSERHGEIQVTVETSVEDVQISIEDNGHGIPAEVAERIFKPYFTTKTSGTGLGLAMTRKIIELWKGNIWFESEEDKGTTFFIRLPLYRDDGE